VHGTGDVLHRDRGGGDRGDCALSLTSILDEHLVAHLDVPGPVLGVDDEDAARTDDDVVEVGALTSWPREVVEHDPLLGQRLERTGHSGLALGPPLPQLR
jgi:hypothetical protein